MRSAERVLSGGVLLVDDDVGLLRTASEALVTEGFDVVSAQSGAGALHHLNQGFRPAVLVTAVRMPGISGVELADAVREVSPATAVLLLAESAAAHDDLVRRVRAPVLVKPFPIVDLVTDVRALTSDAVRSGSYSFNEAFEEIDLSPPPHPLRDTVWPWIAAALLIVVAWLVNDFLSRRTVPPADPAPTKDVLPRPAPSARAIASEPLPVSVPPLDASDTLVRDLIRSLSSHPHVLRWLATDGLIRTFAMVVNDIAIGAVPAAPLQPFAASTGFRVRARQGRTYIDPFGYARYDHIAHIVASISPADAARLYATLEPRIAEAHRELGFTDVSFDEILERAIMLIVTAPVSDQPIQLALKGANYQFANRRVEELPPVQRQVLRMGPDNARVVQKRLREIGWALGLEV